MAAAWRNCGYGGRGWRRRYHGGERRRSAAAAVAAPAARFAFYACRRPGGCRVMIVK